MVPGSGRPADAPRDAPQSLANPIKASEFARCGFIAIQYGQFSPGLKQRLAVGRRAFPSLAAGPGLRQVTDAELWLLARALGCPVADLLPRNARSVVPVLRQGED